MALTAQQLVDTRRYMGYSVSGNTASQPFRELVYSEVSYMGLSLDYRLANLSAEEETVVTGTYLTNLNLREQDIQSASDNLDTDQAAVWKRSSTEMADRIAVFNYLRRQLCEFLGFAPGSQLNRGNSIVRA